MGLLAGIAAAPAASAAEPPPGPYAMWVWNVRHVTTDAGRAQLVAFCRAHRVSALYLSAYQFAPVQAQQYRTFLREAHREGIAVHALAGDPRWALSRYHSLPLAWVQQVIAFNDDGPPEERFDGVHTDVEPYLLSRAWMEHPAQLIGGLLDLHAKMAALLRSGQPEGTAAPAAGGTYRPLRLGADVPFWFDDDPTYLIQWHDHVLPPSHHLLDIADYVTVMAYRNYAEGSEGAIEISRRELEYAEQVGKFIVVGQETQADLFPAYVTYGGASTDYFWGELRKIAAAFRGHRAFGGFAIHHYESYRKFLEKQL